MATSAGARRGLLLRGGDVLEASAEVDVVALDKTGTITEGKPRVTGVSATGDVVNAEVLRLAAAVEATTSHPLAAAVEAAAAAAGATTPRAVDAETAPGRGASAVVEGRRVFVGSPEWVESQVGAAAGAAATLGGAAAENSAAVGGAAAAACSLVAVGVEGEGLIGAVALADKVRPGAPQAVRRLRDMGLKVVILSGDRQPAVDAVARELGLGEGVVAAGGLLPADKEAYVKRLQADGAKVAMVGDGINDAPALVAADVGMAVSGGMEATAQAAGVVLLGSEAAAEEGGGVGQAADAVELGRNALGKIRQNLAWALAYNLVGIPVAAGVLLPEYGVSLNPAAAGAMMALSSVAVVTNSLMLKVPGEEQKTGALPAATQSSG